MISLDAIVDHLVPSKDVEENDVEEDGYLPCQKGKKEKAKKFPEGCQKFFRHHKKEIMRKGILSKPTCENSLLGCILYFFKEDFSILNNRQQQDDIDTLRNKLLLELSIRFISAPTASLRPERIPTMFQTHYKSLGWKKKELLQSIKNPIKNPNLVLRFLTDYFFMNIFVLDLLEQSLYLFFPEASYLPEKKNIFLTRLSNGIYEPLVCTETWDLILEDIISKHADKIICPSCNFRKGESETKLLQGAEEI